MHMRTPLLCLLLLVFAAIPGWTQQVSNVGPLPTATQLQWHEKEFYLFIHFGPNTFTDKEWGDGKEDPTVFNPTALDCRQWARLAKKAGAKGIILTAKHHDGFSLWPSQYSTHTVRESKWMDGKGDVVKSLSEACKAEGIEMGVYISPWDRNHPAYGTPAYNDVYIATMKELLTGYGQYFELWWDGANGEGPNGKKQQYDFKRFEDSAFHYQPQLIIFSDIGPSIRWCGNENGFIGNTNWNLLDTAGFSRGLGAPHVDTLNQGNINGKHWIPAEADVSIRPGWFYHTAEDSKVKTPETLFNIYLRSVGNGGNLLLNVPPDRRGRFHEADSAALMGFAELRKKAFANNLFQKAVVTSNDLNKRNLSAIRQEQSPTTNTYWQASQAAGSELVFQLNKTTSINAIVLQEMIRYGQRVSGFRIEAWVNNAYQTVFEGTTIGRKKIASFQTVETNRLKIIFTQGKAPAFIRFVGGYLF
ncbi:MAG: alpha-L-fucosidase [Chitinophagaceae bacterium]|nr:alpha-L-fucosidase [Chitinophagaceae bacterium]